MHKEHRQYRIQQTEGALDYLTDDDIELERRLRGKPGKQEAGSGNVKEKIKKSRKHQSC